MMEHELKTWPPYFQQMVDGVKAFELRRNDRNFTVGDTLWLREWLPESKTYTGREYRTKITTIIGVPEFGLKDGYVILGTENVDLRQKLAAAPAQAVEAATYRGYALAVAVQIRDHGNGTIVDDLIRAGGLTIANCVKYKVDKYDMELLLPELKRTDKELAALRQKEG